MTTARIDKEDVIRIAKSIGKSLTEKQIETVLSEYPQWEKQDPTATWNLIIEDLIYFVQEDGPFDQLGYEQTKEE